MPPSRKLEDNLEDYRWLTSEEGRAWAERFASRETSVRRSSSLSAERIRLLAELAALRRRGEAKFSRAAEMFFTRLRLEQATDETTARHKGRRFAGLRMADLCCGIGGDTLGIAAAASEVDSIDADAIAAHLATANVEAHRLMNVRVRTGRAEDMKLADYDTWHIDPDRRREGRRSVRADRFEPTAADIAGWLALNPHAAIKVAPASPWPAQWPEEVEREWIEFRGECRQQIGWLGDLSTGATRRATFLSAGGDAECFVSEVVVQPTVAESLGRYIYDPRPALVAARLVGAFAAQHRLEAAADERLYLTSDRLITEPGATAFEVEHVDSFDRKRWKKFVRARGIDALEVKKRGVDLDPEQVRKVLKTPGDQRATLILMRKDKRVIGVLARRV